LCIFCAADEQRAHLLRAVDEYHNKTSIHLREYDPAIDTDYIYITGEKSGCWSYVGRVGGVSYLARSFSNSFIFNSAALVIRDSTLNWRTVTF